MHCRSACLQNAHYLISRFASGSRGNILTWERLGHRLEGTNATRNRSPDVMGADGSAVILYRTLWLFGLAFLAAVLVIGGLIWLTMRRAPEDPEPSSHPPAA